MAYCPPNKSVLANRKAIAQAKAQVAEGGKKIQHVVATNAMARQANLREIAALQAFDAISADEQAHLEFLLTQV